MSSPDNHMKLARRVCDASKAICELISSRVPIKTLRGDVLDRSSEVIDPATSITLNSMTVEQQIAHFARLDEISAQIDEWEGISPSNVTRTNSRAKRIGLEDTKRNSLEESNQSIELPEEMINANDIKAFNEHQFSSAIDIAKICDQDKHTFRPIFRHVPKLKEVLKHIEDLIDVKTQKPAEESEPSLTVLLEEINKVYIQIYNQYIIFYITIDL